MASLATVTRADDTLKNVEFGSAAPQRHIRALVVSFRVGNSQAFAANT